MLPSSTTNAKGSSSCTDASGRFLSRVFDEIGAGNGGEGFLRQREKGVTCYKVAIDDQARAQGRALANE